MKKRLLSIFLTITMLCTMLSALNITAGAATTRCDISADWQGVNYFPTGTGYYYLTSDVYITGSNNIHINNKTVRLDLNGHDIYFNGKVDASAINVYSSGKLYLYDSSNGSGEIYCQTYGNYQRAVYLASSGAFYMYGGKIRNFGSSNQSGGAVIICDGNFYMYGGTITSCSGNNGGAICVENDKWGNIYMYGGTISYCKAAGNGGAIDASNDYFYMSGGTITRCTSSNLGGGVSVWDGGGTFEMTGGTISYCTANVDGGAVYCCGKSVTMSGGSLLYNTSSTASGGAIAASNNASIIVSGGEIAYNSSEGTSTSVNGGGAIASWAGVNITVKGTAYIHDNKARQGGAIYCPNTNASGSITISGGYIAQPDGTTYNIYARQITPTYNSGRLYTGSYYYNSSSLNNKYSTVTLNPNGGSGGTASVSGQYWNTAMTSATMPTRTGYDFNGYYNATSGGDQYYTSTGASARNWDYIGAQTLYAQWTEHTATLTYNANGHGTAPNAVTMKYTAATNAAAALSEDYYTFQNWNTKPDGTGTAYSAGAEIKAANDDPAAMTLYAQWTGNTYPVTLDNGEGSGETSVTATYGAAMPKVTPPTWDKHVFQGYFTQQGEAYYDANGESVKAWDQDSDSVTLYAHWADSAKIEDLSLELDGDIGMRFHSTVNEEALKTGYMTMSVGGKAAKTQTVHYNETEKDSTGKAIFSFDVSAIELAEKITANFYDENGTLYDTASESVEDYYGLLKEDTKVAADAKAVVKALVNYGHFAQQALSKTRGWTIGSDYAATAKQNDLTATAEDLKAYSPIIIGNDDHVKGIGMSLLLDNKTTLCLYFTTSDGEMPRVRVDGGGELIPIEYDETANVASQYIERMSDGRWLVRIPNIDAVNLGTIHKVTADGRTIYLSALSYGSVITGEENVNAICALYEYYQAALQYAKLQEITSVTAQDASYTGSAIEPVLTVMSGNTALTESQYEVEWIGNLIEVGTHIGIVRAKSGNLVGGALVQFMVNG